MFLPIKWLKNYVDIKLPTKEIADGLTYSGSHVESIKKLNNGISNVVVGKIIKVKAHPNADKLKICTVDVSDEILTIVTGADNVREGDLVPVAKVGAKLPDGKEITEADFRGEKSYGMLCSLKELGYEDNVIPKEAKDGIFIIDDNVNIGENIVDVLSLDDEIIEFEITPNRPDCLSIYGMARETSATFNLELKKINVEIINQVDDISNLITGIDIKTNNCHRYYAKVIKDVNIKPSPLWLQTALMNAGIRPINNIVDVTNYVMLELGEPLHAFDASKIEGNKIIVRQANDLEELVTLDGVKRELKQDDIVIADIKKPIGLAGIMGGLNTEITSSTKLVLIEGANFEAKNIRLSSKRLGLRTEASTRFEKGVDESLCSFAVERACQLIEMIGAGKIINGSYDIIKNKNPQTIISLRPNRIEKLLGVKIPENEILNYLNRLEFEAKLEGDKINVKVPTFRKDVSVEADLIEEVGRLFGFHNIKPLPLYGNLTRGSRPKDKEIQNYIKDIFWGIGFNEAMTYSFLSPKVFDKLNLPQDHVLRNCVRLMNPLGEDYSVMRTSLIPNMLDLLNKNNNRGIERAMIYEIGNIFVPNSIPDSLPDEMMRICLGIYGDKDFYFMKDAIETLLERLGIKDVKFSRENESPIFHPGKSARILKDGRILGVFGEVHPEVLKNYNFDNRVYIGDLDFNGIFENINMDWKYTDLPKYPSIDRDIAIVVDEDVAVGDIEEIIYANGEGLIESIDLFDIYRGNQIDNGKKSLAFSIRYRSNDRTLKDEDIIQIQKRILNKLEERFHAKLRG
ncbi:MAG: phenylalanine--tRNA ligase subunit beta [Tissierellales bacterium]|nr:phenylalanine--tRNA ligase subunit beta [Tissierellales bacterium]